MAERWEPLQIAMQRLDNERAGNQRKERSESNDRRVKNVLINEDSCNIDHLIQDIKKLSPCCQRMHYLFLSIFHMERPSWLFWQLQ
jgi:hypothetical protein